MVCVYVCMRSRVFHLPSTSFGNGLIRTCLAASPQCRIPPAEKEQRPQNPKQEELNKRQEHKNANTLQKILVFGQGMLKMSHEHLNHQQTNDQNCHVRNKPGQSTEMTKELSKDV